MTLMFDRLKTLFAHTTVYGMGDVAPSLLSLLLLPIFTRHLAPADYGVIALLMTVEAGANVVFRWGIDSAFMRLFYDCADMNDRRRLASSIFVFLLATNGVLLIIGLLAAPRIAAALLGTPAHSAALRLVILNAFVVGFFFIPLALLRIERRSSRFAKVTFSRAAATICVRLLLVVGLGMGVFGFFLANVLVTAVFSVILGSSCARLIRPLVSRPVLGEVLHYGLPRLPHGLAHLVIAWSDRYILSRYATVSDVGVYAIGATLGLGVKYFLRAFQTAWSPFLYEMMDETDAHDTYRAVTSYALLLLVFMATVLSATAEDLLRLATTPEYHGAARVVPWVAMGAVLQGVYQLTSVGLSITKRTVYYPVATGLTLAGSISANLVLIPYFGIMGAAYTHVFSYGILAAAGMTLSQRQYPIRYEWGRLLKIATAGLGTFALASSVPLGPDGSFGSLCGRGALVTIGYPAALFSLGFFRDSEIARMLRVLRGRRCVVSSQPSANSKEQQT